MAADKKINLDSPNLLVEYREEVSQAIKKAVRDALLKHKQANNPVAVFREGKVVLLSPEEIIISNEDETI